MEKANSFLLSFVLQFLCFLVACIAKNISTDQSALLAFKARVVTLNSSHPLSLNWSSQAPVCDWIGVTCGSRHRRVTALNVSDMDIHGSIPPQLGNISFLFSLDLSRNYLHGELPQELSRLRRLKVMDLGYNNFSGEIPMWFGFFSELQMLILNHNDFTGSLPVDICRHLQRIKSIAIVSNLLTGHIPAGLSNCTELYALRLQYNKFNGTIPPEIVNLERLEFLNLGGNNLQGTIPAKIDNLRNLQQLTLENNHIVGSIPRTISNLTSLWLLNLNTNSLSDLVVVRKVVWLVVFARARRDLVDGAIEMNGEGEIPMLLVGRRWWCWSSPENGSPAMVAAAAPSLVVLELESVQ